MLNQFNFYFHQGRTAVKKSIITLFAIGMAVSLISGVNYYIDSFQAQAFDESLQEMFDFSFYQQDIVQGTNTILSMENQAIIEDMLKDNDIDYDELYPFLTPNIIDYFGINGSIDFQMNPFYYISSSDFYNSTTFQDKIYLTAGNTPINENEIMIDELFAKENNLNVGNVWSYTYNTTEYVDNKFNSTFVFNLNFTIAGTYLPLQNYIDFSVQSYHFDHYYIPESNEIKRINVDSYYSNYNLIFSALNPIGMDNSYSMHPVQEMIDHWKNQSDSLELNMYISTYSHGFTGSLDRSKISYRNTINTLRSLETKADLMYRDFSKVGGDFSGARYDFYIIYNLENFINQIRVLRFVLQLFTIPILLCAFYIAIFWSE